MSQAKYRMRLLGQVATCDRSAVHPLTGKSATIVAVLAAARRSWIEWDVLAEEAWSGGQPTRGTVHTAISRCRSALRPGLAERLESGPLGYRLALGDGESDLDEFEALARSIDTARSEGRSDTVLALADEAARLWSDRPFANVLDSQRVAAFASAVERQRWDVVDAGAAAALAAGVGHRWCTRLERVVADEPLRQTSAILLADCEHGSGNQAAAVRVLSELRRRLCDVGLVATPEIIEAEQRILVEEPVRPSHPYTQQSFAHASLPAAQEHLRAGRFRAALLEAERVISQQTRISAAGVAEAWTTVALACDALVRPLAFRQALTAAVTAAIQSGDSSVLRRALALSARATAPGEPNRGVVDALATVSVNGEDEAWVAAALAVNTACEAEAGAVRSAREQASAALDAAVSCASPALVGFATECWLRLTEGAPDVEAQRDVADRWVATACSHTVSYTVAVAHRALRALRAGDRRTYEDDISTIEGSASTRCMAEDQAISMQMRSSLSMADGEWSSASTMIDAAADLVLDHPVHQEVAAIQRWWMSLRDDPARYLDDLRAVVELGRSPSYSAILAYTLLHCDDADGARAAFESVFVGDRLIIEPDSSYPTAVAGLAAVAVWLDARHRFDELAERLAPYSGQILVAPGQAFVLGSADRFIGRLALASGEHAAGVVAPDRAWPAERRPEFAHVAAATATAVRAAQTVVA